jgi:hypothetical protein
MKPSWQFADPDYSLYYMFDSKYIDSLVNCDLCGKEFNYWEGLFGHMKSHSKTHQDSGDVHQHGTQ